MTMIRMERVLPDNWAAMNHFNVCFFMRYCSSAEKSISSCWGHSICVEIQFPLTGAAGRLSATRLFLAKRGRRARRRGQEGVGHRVPSGAGDDSAPL
jgi:hypothetical protein